MDSRFRGNDRFRPLAGNHAPLGRTTEFILPPRRLLEAVDHRDYFELLGWNFREGEDIDQADNMFKYGIYLMYLNSCSRRFGCIEENLVFRSRLG